MKKNLQIQPLNRNKIYSVLLFLFIIVCSPFHSKADANETVVEVNYYTFPTQSATTSYFEEDEDDYNRANPNKGYDYENIQLNLTCFFDKDTKDIGFYRSYSSNKLIYSKIVISPIETKPQPKYLKRVTIDWSSPQGKKFGGCLSLVGRTLEKGEYPDASSTSDTLSYNDDNDLKYYLFPPEGGGEVTYTLAQPMPYAAIYYNTQGGTNENIARFKSITLTFTDDPMDGVSSAIVAHIGDIDSETFQYTGEWRNNPLVISDSITLKGIENISDFDSEELQFFLTPLFEPTGKPDAVGDVKPTEMTDQEWRLYRVLEAHSDSYLYDGFLTSMDDIPCRFNFEDDNTNTLSIEAPCSGTYTLGLRSEKYEVSINKAIIILWPGISNTYEWIAEFENQNPSEPVYYFGLNWVNVREDESGETTLFYPYSDIEGQENEPYAKESGIIHVPGLYNYEVWYKMTGTANPQELASKRRIAADEDGFVSLKENPFNLETLSNDNDIKMELKLKKNGVETPLISQSGLSEINFKIQLSDTQSVPLAVNSILEENSTDSAVEYYGLNGMKLNSSILTPGLYIRKQGSKIEKIIVR